MEIESGKYLTFQLGKEEYGIHILKVKEIIRIMDITKVPRTPRFIKGVINLRGKIVPIMDLRNKFGLEEREYNQRTCIIVVEVYFMETKKQMGIVVDTVSEVVNVNSNEIELPQECREYIDNGFLLGIGKVKGKVILLLDIERILDTREMIQIKEMM